MPATPGEIAEKFQIGEAVAKKKLDEFVRKGMALSFIKEGQLRYFFARSVGQLHDTTSAAAFNRLYEPVPEELLELWE